jgi:hypothetical protein
VSGEAHVVPGGALGPTKLRFQARQEIAVAEQLLSPPQSPADLGDDREVPTARVPDALRQLVNLGAAFLWDAAIVKEGLGQSFAQRDGAGDRAGDERRLKTLSPQGWVSPGSAALEGRLRHSMTDDDACPAGLASTFRRSYACGRRACRHLTPAEPKHPERDQRQPKLSRDTFNQPQLDQ